MKIDVLTLFPGMFTNFLEESMVKIARDKKALEVRLTDIRDYAFNKHRSVDDYPYGGGAGMVLKPEPLYEAITAVKDESNVPVIYFTPQGKPLTQKIIRSYASANHLILLCGHYKEIDQRIRDSLVTAEYSIGDYVLSGGELPAMVFIDAVARLQEGVLNDSESAATDSHENGLLGAPHYTRPPEFRGMKVPEVLLSGNHAKIADWRRKKAIEKTTKIRPELLDEKK
ncbi:MAG: tRNA (guanine37-N1)-methyltransferase [Candidatus Cloacimonadota bacterium]|jgi:tRNA (guanine37-N1)-methyltransferase|nr:tRNA (guanine37-N1)-methyltransferase [Candidatus Cloacimonadota bacterium]